MKRIILIIAIIIATTALAIGCVWLVQANVPVPAEKLIAGAAQLREQPCEKIVIRYADMTHGKAAAKVLADPAKAQQFAGRMLQAEYKRIRTPESRTGGSSYEVLFFPQGGGEPVTVNSSRPQTLWVNGTFGDRYYRCDSSWTEDLVNEASEVPERDVASYY